MLTVVHKITIDRIAKTRMNRTDTVNKGKTAFRRELIRALIPLFSNGPRGKKNLGQI